MDEPRDPYRYHVRLGTNRMIPTHPTDGTNEPAVSEADETAEQWYARYRREKHAAQQRPFIKGSPGW